MGWSNTRAVRRREAFLKPVRGKSLAQKTPSNVPSVDCVTVRDCSQEPVRGHRLLPRKPRGRGELDTAMCSCAEEPAVGVGGHHHHEDLTEFTSWHLVAEKWREGPQQRHTVSQKQQLWDIPNENTCCALLLSKPSLWSLDINIKSLNWLLAFQKVYLSLGNGDLSCSHVLCNKESSSQRGIRGHILPEELPAGAQNP